MNKHLIYQKKKKRQKDLIQYASFSSLIYIQSNTKCSAIIFIL